MALTATATRGFTFSVGVELSPDNLNALGVPTIAINESDAYITGGSVLDVTLRLKTYSVAALPSPDTQGYLVFCTNGDGGDPCLAVDDGSNWRRIALGAAVST